MIVLGSNSEIAQSFVEECLSRGEKYDTIFLLSSDKELAGRYESHLMVKYNQHCEVIELDITKEYDCKSFGNIDSNLLFCATGYLGKGTEEGLYDDLNTKSVIDINYAKLVPLLNFFAKKMEAKKSGIIIALSSVAGDRGRQSNFIYGSAKAGLTAYLSGLRNYMYDKNVHVMTVKPGFMDTKMTQGMPLNPALTASPHQAACLIYKAYKRKKSTAYIIPVWRIIMFIIRNIPEWIFKRMKM